MFDTCTHKCGYCWLAESGQVLDFAQLDRFRDLRFIDSIAHFFKSRSDDNNRWLVQFTGGEPLIAPNLSRLCKSLFDCGNRVAFYTALLVGENHPGFRLLAETKAPDVDYIMASLHPESEDQDTGYFAKIHSLRKQGHRVFLRYVGHPARLGRLDELSARCKDLDVAFYPTTLLSNSYPAAYTTAERKLLSRHFSSLSQFIQIEGGLDTTKTLCHAGSRLIAVNLQTGNVTPCITVPGPSLGNVFEDRLALEQGAMACPSAGINCLCDVHYQQDIVVGAEDRAHFQRIREGFSGPLDFSAEIDRLRKQGMAFYVNPRAGIGDVQDESRLSYSQEEVKRRFRERGSGLRPGAPPAAVSDKPFAEVDGAIRVRDAQLAYSGAVLELNKNEMTVLTAAQPWAYAVRIPLHDRGPAGRRGMLRATVRVEQGILAVGAESEDGTQIVGEQMLSALAGTEQEARVFVPDISRVQALMLRNGPSPGETRGVVTSVALHLESPPVASSQQGRSVV
jgi:organic radical activating enzyme